MSNQIIILMLVGALVGFWGKGAVSSLNPFKSSTAKVQVVKNESQKEEYFRDKVKGIEYRMSKKGQEQTPVKKTLGSSVGSFIDNFWSSIVKIGILFGVIFFMTGINLFKYILRLRKTLTQLVKGIDKAKPRLNGEQKALKEELSSAMDEDSKRVVDDLKRK